MTMTTTETKLPQRLTFAFPEEKLLLRWEIRDCALTASHLSEQINDRCTFKHGVPKPRRAAVPFF